MKNILYLHGFGSNFANAKEKVKVLEDFGTVHGIDIFYERGFDRCLSEAKNVAKENNIDLVVGTSMGGHLASHVGSDLGIPFVALNPVLDPKRELVKYIGEGISHANIPYILIDSIVKTYPFFSMNGCGLILLDNGDLVLNSHETYKVLSQRFPVKSFEGGGHRFNHMKESMETVEDFFENACLTYEN